MRWFSLLFIASLVFAAPLLKESGEDSEVTDNTNIETLKWTCNPGRPCFVFPTGCEEKCHAGLLVNSTDSSSTEYKAFVETMDPLEKPVIALRMIEKNAKAVRLFICVPHLRKVFMAWEDKEGKFEIDNEVAQPNFISADSSSNGVLCTFFAPTSSNSSVKYQVAEGKADEKGISLENGMVVKQVGSVEKKDEKRPKFRALEELGLVSKSDSHGLKIAGTVKLDSRLKDISSKLTTIANHDYEPLSELPVETDVTSGEFVIEEESSGEVENLENSNEIVDSEQIEEETDPKLSQTELEKKEFEKSRSEDALSDGESDDELQFRAIDTKPFFNWELLQPATTPRPKTSTTLKTTTTSSEKSSTSTSTTTKASDEKEKENKNSEEDEDSENDSERFEADPDATSATPFILSCIFAFLALV